ncbi:twin-arginine translocation signal domain-containing protein [Ramlibacter terrae]|uniref:Twin-arginine translocation signal domain-containing protein n=1 Tax=Ramlibacter terrae TaxID=2732511 RepID=A0ABX6P2C1_9BURK|nr:twin-arginine translocation signal domain-containing protein [Ramlibacter terrae]
MSESQPKPSRRGFIMGAAVAGAATAAVVALPPQQAAEPEVTEAPPKPERGGGYRVSDHVQQYYKTTLV